MQPYSHFSHLLHAPEELLSHFVGLLGIVAPDPRAVEVDLAREQLQAAGEELTNARLRSSTALIVVIYGLP